MPRTPSPRRYAQAVFEIAIESHDLEAWAEDLRVMADALQGTDLLAMLDAPQVPGARKVETIRLALGDLVGQLRLNLLSLLASRNLAHSLPRVLDEYERLVDVHNGIERAEVVSAVPLAAAQNSRIAGLLGGVVGKQVRLTPVVEPRVLGGIIARVGDRVIDGSVRAKLQQMRRSIVERA